MSNTRPALLLGLSVSLVYLSDAMRWPTFERMPDHLQLKRRQLFEPFCFS